MRALLGSVFVASAVAGSLFSAAQASPMFVETGPGTERFAVRPGSTTMGMVIIDGYRTLDGRNFYHDESSRKLDGGGALSSFFRASDEKGDLRPALFLNTFVSGSTLGRGGARRFLR